MSRIESIVARLNRTRSALEDAVMSIPTSQWRQPPRPGAWSAAEVIAHLTMVEQRVSEGAAKLTAGEPRPVGFWRRLHIPPIFAAWRGFRAQTPIPLDPSLVAEREEMWSRLAMARKKTLEVLESTSERDLRAYRWNHPFFGSLNFYDWFKMIAYHEARHTKQIRETVKIFRG